jgi:glutathione S-transferase
MLSLYYGPRTCSLAPHIVLEEGGEKYQAYKLDLSKKENRTPAYLKINPHGRVPSLLLDSGEPITENTAILPYLGKRYRLWPTDLIEEARALSILGFFATMVHPANGHANRPERYATDPAAHQNIRETGLASLYEYLQETDEMLEGKQWMLGDTYSVLDPYALVFYNWGVNKKLPVGELKNYTAHKDRLLQRPAVQRALDDEGIKLQAA